MPFNDITNRISALYAFVDQFAQGDTATRATFDQVIGDVVSSVNQLAAYLETLVGSGVDARVLGPKAATPTLRNDGSALQVGDFYLSTNAAAGRVGLFYRYDGAQFLVVSDFSSVGAFGAGFAAAATPSAARGLLELGTAAQQNATAFAAASVASDVAVALKLADSSGLAKPVTGNDWDNAHSTGPGTSFLQANSAATNGPVAANLSGFYVAYDANNGFLIAVAHSTGLAYTRSRFGGTWGAWRQEITVPIGATLGQLVYRGATNFEALAKGSARQVLMMADDASTFNWQTIFQCRAWVNFNGTPTAGTYVRAGNTVTVTMTAHGMTTGQRVTLDFTSGTATDGAYTITVIDANTFTVQDAASGATSGNVSRNIWIRASANVASMSYNGAGDYTITFATAMPDADYAVVTSTTNVGNRASLALSINRLAEPTTTTLRLSHGPTGADGVPSYPENTSRACVAIFR